MLYFLRERLVSKSLEQPRRGSLTLKFEALKLEASTLVPD
jgi:hypothetical protein